MLEVIMFAKHGGFNKTTKTHYYLEASISRKYFACLFLYRLRGITWNSAKSFSPVLCTFPWDRFRFVQNGDSLFLLEKKYCTMSTVFESIKHLESIYRITANIWRILLLKDLVFPPDSKIWIISFYIRDNAVNFVVL